MKKACHLFNPERGSRYPMMISQGLLHSPAVQAAFSHPVMSQGKAICPETPDIKKAIDLADIIFRPGDDHFALDHLDDMIGDLWYKVVYYDFKDTTDIDHNRLVSCRLYVKRTWNQGPMMDGTGGVFGKVVPGPYGVLDEYLIPQNRVRDIDLVYLFQPKDQWNEANRFQVYKALMDRELVAGTPDWHIGYTTYPQGDSGRRAILDPPGDNNVYTQYSDILSRTKVIFTCQPNHPGGDSRIWEAFASGALVVTDWPWKDDVIPNRPIDGVHCLIYDSSSEADIQEAIHRVKAILEDPARMAEIAANGRDWVTRNHMAVNRVEDILSYV